MKKLLLTMFGVLMALPAISRDFEYEYEGQTITYTVIDEDAKTVSTKKGSQDAPGNVLAGEVNLPAEVFDGTTKYTLTKIEDIAFAECSSLTSVTIPNSVTSIGNNAFSGCSCLPSVTIPESVTEIGYGAFYGCISLTSVTIPESVTEIRHVTFAGCSSLTSVTIPESVTIIYNEAFWGCSSLTSVTIPESVAKIGDSAFAECSSLTSVTIPESVAIIGNYAFSGCSSLTSVTIPQSVTEIGYGAFANCTNLTSVTIPQSVAKIGNSAFSGCSSLKIYIESLTQLLLLQSGGLTEVEYYLNGERVDCSNDDGCIYTNNGKTLVFVNVAYPDKIIIPEGVTLIKSGAFSVANQVWDLSMPSTIEEIEADAFDGCYIKRVDFADFSNWYNNVKLGNLKSCPYYSGSGVYAGGIKVSAPELSEGIEEIPDYKYYRLPDNSGEIELPSTLKRIGAYAFCGRNELYSVIMPEGLEEIGKSAFADCVLLENLELPSTLVSIEDNAFKGCANVTEVNLPEGLTNLGTSVFSNCTKIEKAVLVADIETIGTHLFDGCTSLYKVYLPLNLKSIGSFAFYECPKIEEVTFPATLETIGECAFACGYVENGMSYGKYGEGDRGSIGKLIIPNSVKDLGKYAFYYQGIKSLSIGSGLESIPEGAFGENPLESITFSEGLKTIDSTAFAQEMTDEGQLCSVKLPSSLTSIKRDAFREATITELVIPDGVSDLPRGCCGKPSILTLGSGIKTIDSKAFDFENLHVLRVKANTPPTLNNQFDITDEQNDGLTLIVNNGRRNNYVSNARWRQIDNIIEESSADITVYMTGAYALSEEIRTTTGLMPSSVTKMKVVGPLTETDMRIISENMISLQSLDMSEVTNVSKIPDRQFAGSLLVDIKLPKGLTAIGYNAFSDCSLLQIAELPDGIIEIDDYAFSNSPRVTLSTLPSSLKSIGKNAFASTGIRSITAGKDLERLSEGAFEGCSMLESVDFSETSLSEIPENTFLRCHELDEIILPESVKNIGPYAFAGTAIRDIAFAANTSEMGFGAFSDCRRLVAANLPSKVKSVSSGLFANCPRMIAISMPSATTNVAPKIVSDNKKMANVSCAAVDAPAAETGAFDGLRMRYVSLIVPTISFRAYLNAPQWGKFQSIQNKIPVSIDPGVDVSNVAEEEYQDMLTEDALEEATEAAAQETEVENPEQIRRRSARRSAARTKTYDGTQFAALFNGAQIQNGTEGSATRIFVNPKEGVNVTSVLFNDEEMLDKMEGNSLLLPAGANGSLVIKTDAKPVDPDQPGDEDGINAAEADVDVEVYDLTGVKVADSLHGLSKGVYIVRQGANTTKVAI